MALSMTHDLPRADRGHRFWMAPARLLKASRPGFWPTHLWFFLLPLGQREMFASPGFWIGCVYVCFPLGLLLYGWNDIGDAETDRLNPRKDSWLFGARLDDADLAKLPRLIALVQLPFVVAFAEIAGARALLWFATTVGVNALYNAPRIGWKSLPGLDLANQVGYLLVFVLASWICGVPQLSLPAMIFSAIFAMQSHLFGQIMDVAEDRAAGRRTTAVSIGVRASKIVVVAFLLVEAWIAWRFFSGFVVEAFMLAAAAFFLADAVLGFGARPYPSRFTKVFFVGWNVVVIASAYFVWRDGTFLVR